MALPEQGLTLFKYCSKKVNGDNAGELCYVTQPEIKCDPIGLPLARLMQYACRELQCTWR